MKYPKDHVSYSSFNRFEECPRKWWFEYVRYPEERVETGTFAIGNAYHEAVAEIYRGKTLEESEEVYMRRLGENASYKDSQGIKDALRYYYTNVYPYYRNKVGSIEVEKTIKVPGISIPLMYRMDLETLDGILVDHKTVGGRIPKIANNQQLNIYSLAYLTENGRLPRAVELHLAYKDRGKVEVRSAVPSLPEVLSTLSMLRAFLGMVKRNSFPCRRTNECRNCPFRVECDNLIIASNGDDII